MEGFGTVAGVEPTRDESGPADELHDTLLQNLIESYKRIETDELPGARIRVTYQALAPLVLQSAWYSPRYPMERRDRAPSEQELR